MVLKRHDFFAVERMKIQEFLKKTSPLLDVRSPLEFLQGHIPEAISFPLFSDEERKIVGTVYKQKGKDAAIKIGLDFVGPKLSSFIEQAEEITNHTKTIRLYCARGGMRSASLGWLLQTAGFDCSILNSGYKAFRNWALSQFKIQYSLFVLAGFTGSGKTEILHQLKKKDNQVIDLEKIANHRGSSFGHLGYPKQPSSEHLENILAWELSKCDASLPIWIEDESRRIGSCHLPQDLWTQMTQSPFLWIDLPKKTRIEKLVKVYGNYPLEDLIQAAERLVKKLGFVQTKDIVQAIQNRELSLAASSVLEYYDKTYSYACQKYPRNRTNFSHIQSEEHLIKDLLQFSKNPLLLES